MLYAVKPESMYPMTNLATIDLIPFKTAVVGIATNFDEKRREVTVDLGNGVYGIIPEDEVTVYDFTYSQDWDVPKQVVAILGTKIRAVVTKKNSDNVVTLSRKLSMLEAWKALEENTNITAYVTHVYDTKIFFDVGNGLVSCNGYSDCSVSMISKMNIWFSVGELIRVKILDKGKEDAIKVTSSRKLAYPALNETDIHIGDIIWVKIGKAVNEQGWFCECTPGVPGIIDTRKKLKEGQYAYGMVRKITTKGVHLNLIEI